MGCTQGAPKASVSTQKPTTLLTQAQTMPDNHGGSGKKDTPTMAPEVLGHIDATKATTFVDCTFSPGELGLVADGASGIVKAVSPGQGHEWGVCVDWQLLFIDGQKFTLALLDAKIGGKDVYNITFARCLPPTVSVACTFQPGKIGLIAVQPFARSRTGTVTTVFPGQGREFGVEVGWQITHIDGQPYTGDLLDSKIAGEAQYVITFAIDGPSKIDQPGEQKVEEQKIEAVVVESRATPPRSHGTLDADGQNVKEQNYEEQKVDAFVADARRKASEPESNEQKVEERRLVEQTPIAEPAVETGGVTRKQKPLCCC